MWFAYEPVFNLYVKIASVAEDWENAVTVLFVKETVNLSQVHKQRREEVIFIFPPHCFRI